MKKTVLMDFQAQQKLQTYILKHNLVDQYKNLQKCGSAGYMTGSIAIESNGVTARTSGLMTCENLWACPVCAAIGLTKHSFKIQKMIDEFKKRDVISVMITLSLPHNYSQKPRHLLDKLKFIQQKFFGNYLRSNKILSAIKAFGMISSFECTYGKNGFHFHSHNLLFISRDSLSLIAEAEKIWQQRWNSLTIKYTELEYYKERVEMGKFNYSGVYVSKNMDGSIRGIESANYITAELTLAQTKPTHTDRNRNIWELLYSGDERDLKIFLEYAKATKFRQKISYAKTIIKTLGMKQEEFQRLPEDIDIEQRFFPVCVFDTQTWYELRKSDLCYGTRHRENILYLAIAGITNYWLIYDYCVNLKFKPPRLPEPYELENKLQCRRAS